MRIGFTKIHSNYIAEATGVSSVQVRKDFSMFGITGNKKGGYQIDQILNKLHLILGKNEMQNVIIVGAGKIGLALAQYPNFEREGMKVCGVFDIDPYIIGWKGNVEILPMDKLHEIVRERDVRLGILCVPDNAAQHVCDLMVSAGVHGILNFAPIQLKVPTHCIINNVNLVFELESLAYFVNAANWPRYPGIAPDDDISEQNKSRLIPDTAHA